MFVDTKYAKIGVRMQKLWSTKVGRVFLESYYFGVFQFLGGFLFRKHFLSPHATLSLLSRLLPLGLPSPAWFMAVRPPPAMRPVPFCSPPTRLQNPTSHGVHRRRKRPESRSTWPTATARAIGVGLPFSGQIGRNSYGDLEALGQANPAPPLPIKSVARRRRNK